MYLFLNICFCGSNGSHSILGHHPINFCSATSGTLLPSHSDSASHFRHQELNCMLVPHKSSSSLTASTSQFGLGQFVGGRCRTAITGIQIGTRLILTHLHQLPSAVNARVNLCPFA
jgi:hypothetical protein